MTEVHKITHGLEKLGREIVFLAGRLSTEHPMMASLGQTDKSTSMECLYGIMEFATLTHYRICFRMPLRQQHGPL